MVRIRFSLNRKEVREGGERGALRKEGSRRGLVNCSKNKNCIADIQPKSTHDQPYLSKSSCCQFSKKSHFYYIQLLPFIIHSTEIFLRFFIGSNRRDLISLLLGYIFAHSKNSKSRSLFKNEKYFF